MPRFAVTLATLLAGLSVGSLAPAQTIAAKPARSYVPVCARGVQVFDNIKQVPTPFDSLTMPPGQPVRVTNEAEAEAAELEVRGRAGKVGATGLVITTKEVDQGDGRVTMSRQLQAVFVPADSAKAQKACAK